MSDKDARRAVVARHSPPPGFVVLSCDCGNEVVVTLADYDPDGTRLIETNECDRCDAAMGGFGMSWCYDGDGTPLEPGR